MRSTGYQYTLIATGVIATVLFAMFWQRELFPEYKIYQDDYLALEKFRSSYTHEPMPLFQEGIKQIVFERKDNGPASVERCVSCHVALDIPYFSPTKIERDINGNLVLGQDGRPVQIANDEYVWKRLEADDPELYAKLKNAKVGEYVYDVTKVLKMHPLIGMETRPFEYHPMNEYGCVSCHNGNGQGLTTEKAHGPVFDGRYKEEFEGPKPIFTETDPHNDPRFSQIFNHKPGEGLIFQTSPLFAGALVQAKCINCHQNSSNVMLGAFNMASGVIERRKKQSTAIQSAVDQEKEALISLLEMRTSLQTKGLENSMSSYKTLAQQYSLPEKERLKYLVNVQYFEKAKDQKTIADQIENNIQAILGSPQLVNGLYKAIDEAKKKNEQVAYSVVVDQFLKQNLLSPQAKGSLFEKLVALDFEKNLIRHVEDTENSFEASVLDQQNMSSMTSEVDLMTSNYHRGEQLFLSQACYACHKIAGFSRGGVGPELTREGNSYPWFIKQSIVWPQADLPTSTMPNYHLDHEELEDLVTYLLGQTGESKSISPTQYFKQVQDWEMGKKMAWEKPITPAQMQDVRYAMTVFATQGCSACHRLQGFESNVGYRVELNAKPDFDQLYKEKQWFTSLIPEEIVGSNLVKVLETHKDEIDKHIVDDVRKGSIVEEIDQIIPGQVESLYTPFKFAARAKNHAYQNNPEALKTWKQRVHRVLMMFIQEYGFGRMIGPRPNWSGVYRSDEWLMEHFRNPSQHVARSIMPVLPFDDTKFYALTHMLDVLGKKNRDNVRAIWDHQGFNPEMAFQIHCAQCHGEYKQGNGPVTPWIYPIPKNLNNADFLRNLTKEHVIQSITHGVSGTPMPPWGEVGAHKPYLDNIPVLTESEIKRLTDWIFSSLPGGQVIKGSKDVQKWNYTPEDVIRELNEEGNKLKSSFLFSLPSGKGLLASLEPALDRSKAEDEIFEKKANPMSGEDPWNYYIKKKYYTEENLAAGKSFFEMNCAVCHGTEADGSGARAQQMRDAKPRMLINLDWSRSRDDLRLLRSIKYGVPGTSMTPWGDLTSSMQRLQLVMFIRSLSEDRLLREELSAAIYQAYDHSILAVEHDRVYQYATLAESQKQYEELRHSRENLSALDEPDSKKIVETYQKELEALTLFKKRQDVDRVLLNLRNEISKEKEIYQRLGLLLLGTPLEESNFHNFLKIIALNQDHYNFENNKLELNPVQEDEINKLADGIDLSITSQIEALKKKNTLIKGKIYSIEQANEIKTIQNEIDNYTKLKNSLISGFEEAKRSRLEQRDLFEKFHKNE